MSEQLLHDAAHEIDRYGEPETLGHGLVAGHAEHRRIDADELAACVDERSAGVAGVDGGVGLNEVLERRDAELPAARRADDAHGHRLAQAQRVADRENDVADLEGIRPAEADFGQVGQVDLQQRELGVGVRADQRGHGHAAVGQLHANLVGVANDVIVRDDVAGAVDDDAGAERPAAERQPAQVARRVVDALRIDGGDGGGAGGDGLRIARLVAGAQSSRD